MSLGPVGPPGPTAMPSERWGEERIICSVHSTVIDRIQRGNGSRIRQGMRTARPLPLSPKDVLCTREGRRPRRPCDASARGGYYDKPHGGHRYIPGRFGACESRLGKLMLGSHKKRISKDAFHRVMLWLDANSVYSSAHTRGRTDPLLEYDPKNRTGVEMDRPVP